MVAITHPTYYIYTSNAGAAECEIKHIGLLSNLEIMLSTQFDDKSLQNFKHIPHWDLKDQKADHPAHLEISNIIATNQSVSREKAGVGVFFS